MFDLRTSIPSRISPAILALCERVVPGASPQFISRAPAPHAVTTECFAAVAQQVAESGGSACFGWRVWLWPGVLVEAEFHAVWRTPEGKLVDISPASEGGDRILFLPDPSRVYQGRQIDNVRQPLQQTSAVQTFIRTAEEMFAIMNRGERAEQHGQIVLTGEEAAEMRALQLTKVAAYQELLLARTKPGRNDPCPCGLGRKFKRCCGA